MSLSDYLTLAEASKDVPGHPHVSCVWRWCRKGVKTRGGQTIRLEHCRLGGRIFTTAAWLADFGQRLAEADAEYFQLADAAQVAAASTVEPLPRRRRRKQLSPKNTDYRLRQIEEAENELDRAGLK
ncbi:MAG: DUF1580 domain-containing protein [Phycisphaerae bacterium]|nr:DUF1580 domain-containing protein [Phycisphaerae bacterium]